MGEVRVPANALYSAQTQRAVENFPISGMTLEPAHIAALALIKKAAATTNAELGVLDPGLARAIEAAADLVAAGGYEGDFPIDVFQTGFFAYLATGCLYGRLTWLNMALRDSPAIFCILDK